MKLARGTLVRLAGHVVGGIASLAVLPLLIRHLGVASFGRYVAVLAVIAIAVLASDLGLTGLALRESATATPERRREVLAGLLGVRIAVACAGALAAVGFALAASYPSSVVAGTALASLGLFPQVYAEMIVVAHLVDGRFGWATAIETARSVSASLLVVALVVADASLEWFLAAWALAALLAAALAHASAQQPRGRMRAARGLRGVLAEGSGYGLATLLHVVYFRAVMLVVAGRAAAVQAGWFAAGFRIVEYAGAAAGQAAGSVTPTLARAAQPSAAGRPAFARQAARIIGLAAGLGAVVAIVLVVAAPVLMAILGGDQLRPAVGVLRIQAIAAGLMFPAFAAGAALFALRRHRAMVIANGAALAVAVVMALVLVPGHGARGGATAAALAEGVLLLCELAVLWSAKQRA